MRWRKLLQRGALGLGAFLVLIQFVPYGRSHSNPDGAEEPRWNAPETRDLARRACFDCHSNETSWPWYSHVAPASWLVQHDVVAGREELNFSEWGRPHGEGDEAAETVLEEEMPPWFYVLLHPGAALSDDERVALARGLDATVGKRGRSGNDD